MEKLVEYRFYYKDRRYSRSQFLVSEPYDTFDEAKEELDTIRNNKDVSECHIKKETTIKEIVE